MQAKTNKKGIGAIKSGTPSLCPFGWKNTAKPLKDTEKGYVRAFVEIIAERFKVDTSDTAISATMVTPHEKVPRR